MSVTARPAAEAGGSVPGPVATMPAGDGRRAGPGRARRWWTAMRIGIGLALGRIVIGVVGAHLDLLWFPPRLHTRMATLSNGRWLGAFDRWDAHYYLAIAARGYPDGSPDTRAFFPGYPLVVWLAHLVTGGLFSLAQVGSLVSMVAFCLAAGLIHHLVAKQLGRTTALWATALFCWFPTTVFFLAPYSEALFALAIVAVAVLVDRGSWWWAAAVAGYASATSPESAALTLALVVAALVARRGLARAVGYGLVGSLGAIGFVTYLGVRFGKPFDFADVLPDFHRVTVVPLVGVVQNVPAIHQALHAATVEAHSLRAYSDNIAWMWVLDDVTALLAVVALVAMIVSVVRDHRAGTVGPAATAADPGGPAATAADPGGPALTQRIPLLWIVVLAGITVLATSTVIRTPGGPASTEGTARLISVAFPLYAGLLLPVRRWPALVVVGIGVSVAAAMVTQILFNQGYWVT